MRRLGSLFHTAMNGMAAARRMFAILDAPVPERGSEELDGRGDIELADVGYAYGERRVLEGVTATVRAGSLVAVVGESGGGKSTLAGILAGRRAGYFGRVRVGGVELCDATVASLMRTVTLVSTNGHLFAGTLRENLLLAKADAADDELWAALARCRVDGFVRASSGLGMHVAEGGENLSGGQRQRVCIARALLHDSPIYVFDEATSNVDSEPEEAIGAVIRGLAGAHTVIVVAHRLVAVADADETLVMEGRRLVERGSHDALAAADGPYARVWHEQSELAAFAPAAHAADASARPNAARPVAAVAAAATFAATPTFAEQGDIGQNGAHEAPKVSINTEFGGGGCAVMARMMRLVRPLAGWLVLDLIDERPETPEVTDGADVSFADMSVGHVSFSFTSGERILDDVSCAFPSGEIAFVSGKSGSGKSTLLKLLMRFWDVSAGAVVVHDGGGAGDVDIRRVNTASLQANEAYMTQDTHLFVGTLRENLLLARPDATHGQLEGACEAAALAPLLERLPQGLDTPVAELGSSLSGGERQRIGLARMFLADAPFVLLDESTSALDALNEAAVMRAVARLRDADGTVALVSHRASTCSLADRFYSVERGRLS